MSKTYTGSCHCGRVKFAADIDFQKGTGKCNCTSCWKRRWWSVQVKPEAFRLLSGASDLSDPRLARAEGPHPFFAESIGLGGFCKHCGVHTHSHNPKADWNDGPSYSINVATLDDVDPEELVHAPVTYFDGRADNWWNKPAETRHL